MHSYQSTAELLLCIFINSKIYNDPPQLTRSRFRWQIPASKRHSNLILTNIRGVALATGDSFPQFSAAACTDSLNSVTLPAIPRGSRRLPRGVCSVILFQA